MVDDSDLSKEEMFVLKAIRWGSQSIAYAVGVPNREIRVCSSETVEGYTDGEKFIFINRPFLKIGGRAGDAFHAFDAIKYLLVHEFLHHTGGDGSGDDSTSHGHTAAFYQKFHDILASTRECRGLGGWTARVVACWFDQRCKAGVRLRQADMHGADMLFSECDIEEVKELQAA